MATDSAKSDHISKVRQAAAEILEAADKLRALRREWDYLGLGEALPVDLAGLGHAGITRAQVSAVYTSAEALEALLAQGHGTNLAQVKP